MSDHLFKITFTATGEVRDADGNLIEQIPIEVTRTVTEEEAAEILTAMNQNQETQP